MKEKNYWDDIMDAAALTENPIPHLLEGAHIFLLDENDCIMSAGKMHLEQCTEECFEEGPLIHLCATHKCKLYNTKTGYVERCIIIPFSEGFRQFITVGEFGCELNMSSTYITKDGNVILDKLYIKVPKAYANLPTKYGIRKDN